MEGDDEVKNLKGTSYDFGARMYDPRVGRWLSTDPLEDKYPGISPFTYVANMPVIAIDPDGERVIIIVYSGPNDEHRGAAETRKDEVENMSWFNKETDKVVLMRVDDLGTLKDKIDAVLTDDFKNQYGETIEFSYFGHGGTDGPVGYYTTSGSHNAQEEDDTPGGVKQLSLSGWAEIDFNFRKGGSVANFHGCQTAEFAMKFAVLQDAEYASGYGGKVGVSETYDEFSANWYYWEGEKLYMWDGDGAIVYRHREAGEHQDFYDPRATTENGGWVPNDPTSTEDWGIHGHTMRANEVSSGDYSTGVRSDASGKLYGHRVKKEE
jgi:RHS repeat-associated protein